jgi:hypothetical protein
MLAGQEQLEQLISNAYEEIKPLYSHVHSNETLACYDVHDILPYELNSQLDGG